MDFPLPSGMADDAYLTTLAEALNLALRLYTPDLILYQAGVEQALHGRPDGCRGQGRQSG